MILHGDCLEVMRALDASSVDAIVSDPPYGLGFMGKAWDHAVPGVPFWLEMLRVAKPGAYLVAFGGTRTFHRMACAIEDAGWELRDTLMWVYGSGFPKSLDVSKAIDKAADYRLQAAFRRAYVEAVQEAGLTLPGNNKHDWTVAEHAPGDRWWAEFERWLPGLSDDQRARVDRAVVAKGYRVRRESVVQFCGTSEGEFDITAPATESARQWEGWGTALKPAWEPIILARKPLIGTVAANVLAYGTGALNIDGCRIESDGARPWREANRNEASDEARNAYGHGLAGSKAVENTTQGRWPANLVHDGSEEVLAAFPNAPGQQGDITGNEPSRPGKNTYGEYGPRKEFKARRDGEASAERRYSEEGCTNFAPLPGVRREPTTAARFFYCAKASREDRNDGCDGLPLKQSGMVSNTSGQHMTRRDGGAPAPAANNHPTVKPTDLMRWLCRLVTPPGGLILDPFTGSGSTGRGAILEGFRFTGIELDPDYAAIAEARIAAAVEQRRIDTAQFDLFAVA